MSSASAYRWIPPFLVGFAAAMVGEVAIGLLLYSGEGLLRALTIILATEMGALALGLAVAPRLSDCATVEALRRRWLVCLVAFLLAAGYTTAWTLRSGQVATPVMQAMGLTLLGGLPFYAAGNLLGAMAGLGRLLPRTRTRVGTAAAMGATLGILSGGYAVPRLSAPSVLFFLMVTLSGAALIQGFSLSGPGEGAEGEAGGRAEESSVPREWTPADEAQP